MSTTLNHSTSKRVSLGILLASLVLVCSSSAYETYHNPSTPGQGYCASCHSGFVGGTSQPLHALHTGGSSPITGNCNLCHTGSGRDNPLTMWSSTGLGCMGCHGQDYGETIQANYRGFTTLGLHKQSGYGLRRHHARSGVTVCAGCHDNDANVAPYGENVVTTGLGFTTHYYTRTDVQLGGARINPCNNEDSPSDVDSKGLDNDGDGLYDTDDPDCTGAPVTLTLQTAPGGTILSWPYSFDGWHVQVSTNLGSTWTTLPDVPRETNSTWRLVLQAGGGTRFFRLAK